MTVAPAHIPVPLKIVPTNIIRQAANQVMSGMQTTKPVPATRRFTNMTVPAPTKRAAVRPATANINPVPVLTVRAGTAANVSAIQVTNIPAPAPMKAQAAQVVTGNTDPVPATDRMSGNMETAVVLAHTVVPTSMKLEASEHHVRENTTVALVKNLTTGMEQGVVVNSVIDTHVKKNIKFLLLFLATENIKLVLVKKITL